MDHRITLRLSRFAALALSLVVSAAQAEYVTIHGGPTFTTGSGGYRMPTLPYAPGVSVSGGMAIGNATYFDAAGFNRGGRALRWDASGFAGELDHDAGLASTANGINADGAIVGSAQDGAVAGTPSRAVVWKPTTYARAPLGSINAGNLGSSSAFAINADGLIAGFADRYDDDSIARGTRAVRWSSTGIATMLDPIDEDAGGNAFSAAYAINDLGTIVGVGTRLDTFSDRAVRWATDGTEAVELGVISTDLDGATFAIAVAINNGGTAIGSASKYDPSDGAFRGSRAVRWEADQIAATELQTLGTDGDGNGDASAQAINDGGDIVGYAMQFAGGQETGYRATRWESDSTGVQELDGLDAETIASMANDVNNVGNAVGWIELDNLSGSDRRRRAALWDDEGDALDLNNVIDPELGWTLTAAYGIDDAGWISGIGSFDPDGSGTMQPYDRLFLIQLPEPTTGTAVVAAMTIAALRRRRRHAAPA